MTTAEAKHKSAEEALRDREDIYKFLLDYSKEIILILSKRGKILFANKTTLNNFGYSEEEIVGKSITNFLTKDSIRKSLYALAQEFLGNPQPEMEVRAKTKSGEIRYLRVAKGSVPIHDKGKLMGMMVSAIDITDRRKAEEKLRESEGRFRELWDHAPVAYHTLDINGIITDVNQTEVRMLGYAKEEMVGKSIFEFILPEQRAEAQRRFQQKISGQKISRAESRIYVKKDGSKIYVVIDDVLERDRNGKVTGIWTTIVDITKHKEVEEALKESEKRYKDLVEKAGIAILVDDKEGNFKYVNERYAQIFGYSVEEMKELSIRNVVHPDDVERVMAYHRERLQGKQVPSRYEFKGIRKDKSIIYLEVDTVALKEGENLMGTRSYLWDITERMKTEDMLRESEERFRSVVENSYEGILIVDDTFRLIYCNDELCRMMGYSREEIIDQDFRKFLDDESRTFLVDKYIRRQKEEKIPARYELSVFRKDGEKRLIEISSAVIRDLAGKLKTVAQILDITERKRAEEQIKASLKEKEVLLREIHHRVKNNMQIISSLLNLQASQMKDKDFIKMVKDSQSRIRSMALVHEKLYRSQDFANINFSDYVQSLVIHLFQFNQVNSNLIQLKMNLENVFLDIQTSIPCGLILNELVTNSLMHAFPKGRKGEILVELHPLEEHTFQMIVKDNGVGIPKDLDIKHTTTLGLQIVTMLVNQIEGSIEVQREGGTTVKIVFKESRCKSRL